LNRTDLIRELEQAGCVLLRHGGAVVDQVRGAQQKLAHGGARLGAFGRADRLFAVRQHAIKEVEDFWNKPRFASEG